LEGKRLMATTRELRSIDELRERRTRNAGTADDPNLIYEVQEDAVGGALAAVDVGLNADFIFGTGDSYTHFSAAQLDTSTKATTATLQMRIVGFVPRADNAISANAKVLVRNNLPTETGAAGSTGV
jgi:hypothetical protein